MLAYRLSELPPDHPARSDPFCPPDEPVMCRCLHCGGEVLSSQIEWRLCDDAGELRGFWWCPFEGCDGKGFEFDLHPLDADIWREDSDDGENGDARE
ncbi:MAG: hypothetical protein ACKVS8_07610 [Phycisphaerales bacterium]